MIKLYTWPTPNGRKVAIMLEELGVDYSLHLINIDQDEQFKSEYEKIAPNNKIPAIVDTENNLNIFESGSILLYLAKKYNKFINYKKEWETCSWLMYQMSEIGPMLGQTHHFFYYYPNKSKYSENRFGEIAKNIYSRLEKRLESRRFIIDEYSIVDIAIWPWIARYERQKININEFPNIIQWFKRIANRPAVKKGYNIIGKKEIIPFS